MYWKLVNVDMRLVVKSALSTLCDEGKGTFRISKKLKIPFNLVFMKIFVTAKKRFHVFVALGSGFLP